MGLIDTMFRGVIVVSIFALTQHAMDALKEKQGSKSIELIVDNHSDGEFSLVVKDNGKGIPENVLKYLKVVPFSFGKDDGNGLGLKNCIEIIKAEKGSIDIESKEGVGTSLVMTLPYIKKEQKQSCLLVDFNKNFVIVDDNNEIHSTWRSGELLG